MGNHLLGKIAIQEKMLHQPALLPHQGLVTSHMHTLLSVTHHLTNQRKMKNC